LGPGRTDAVAGPSPTCGAIVACDFFVAVTATFRLHYVFVVIEHGSRRLARAAVAGHPSAAWTLQQLREIVGIDRARGYLIHDRDSVFARTLDESSRSLGLTVLKSPPHSPKASAICERVIGTIRRECPDGLIPLSESHLTNPPSDRRAPGGARQIGAGWLASRISAGASVGVIG
jgi:hypothetical protein